MEEAVKTGICPSNVRAGISIEKRLMVIERRPDIGNYQRRHYKQVLCAPAKHSRDGQRILRTICYFTVPLLHGMLYRCFQRPHFEPD